MKYTLEEIYIAVGREDKTAGVTFRPGCESWKIFGDHITIVFTYTQQEREEMDKMILVEPFSHHGYIRARLLTGEFSDEQHKLADTKGINSEDIIEILYFLASEKNTFHSKETREITKIRVKTRTLPKGRDLDWMYGFKKHLIAENIGLTPSERNFYLAGKYYYEPDQLTAEEKSEIFEGETMNEEIESEFLRIKYMRQEISDDEKKKLAEWLGGKERSSIQILDKYLQQAGSSMTKLVKANIEKAVDLFGKVMHFKERRLNHIGAKPIYLDIDSFLHIYMRHVEELKVNQAFEHKDNFQWNEEDVLSVMEHVIESLNEEIQSHFIKSPQGRYSRFGKQSAYYEGDYYTFHIEASGRISTFHKNKKEHEKKDNKSA